MRRIDVGFGVPLCFFFTVIDRILKLFFPVPQGTTPPRKVLFIKLSEMGAIILSDPLLRRVQKDYPKAEIFFLTFKSNKDLFGILGVVPSEHVLTIRDDAVLVAVWDTIKALVAIRRLKADMVIDLEFFSRFTAIVSYLAGAKNRAGFYRYTMEGLYRGDLLTHRIPYNPHLHISEMFLSIGQLVGQPAKMTPELASYVKEGEISLPRFVPAPEESEMMKKRLAVLDIPEDARVLLINPGEGRIPLREWPLENYMVLARKFLEDEKNYLIIAGASEAQRLEEFHREIGNNRCIHLSGKTSLRELLTLLTMTEAVITNDSGLAHLAALTSIRQFVFFGPESPRIFSPLSDKVHVFYSNLPCSPCLSAYNHRNSVCKNNLCLKTINPDDVWRVIAGKIYAAPGIKEPRADFLKKFHKY